MADEVTEVTYDNIIVNDREIIAYGDITERFCLELSVALRRQQDKVQLQAYNSYGMENVPTIVIRLQTWGGELDPAFGVYDLIRSMSAPVVVEIVGYVASAGTVISCAADRVYINPSATMLVHQAPGGIVGTRNELQDNHKRMELTHKAMIDIYKRKTGLKKKKIESLLNRDTWMTAKRAVENGFADEIGVVL